MKYFENINESYLGTEAPDLIGIQIPGRYGNIFSVYYTAKGSGLHPTVIICQGIPGHDKLQDIALKLRNAGFNVMTFNYSGCWGSAGSFSFRHCVRDTESVIDFISANNRTLKADPERVGILGFSMGGFIAAHTYAFKHELKACALLALTDIGEVAIISRTGEECKNDFTRDLRLASYWLKGTTGDFLYQEAAENAVSFRLSSIAKDLFNRPVLFVEAAQENVAPPKSNIYPLLDTLLNQEKTARVEVMNTPVHVVIDGDHHFAGNRDKLAQTVNKFFAGYL